MYIDTAAIVQIIGCVFNNASILDKTDKYIIREDDFVEDFHKIVFGTIYNIHLTGSQVTLDAVIDYLANRPKFEAIFKLNKGIDYLTEASKLANESTFNYYYGRLKKFSLLRAYDSNGINVKDLYDPDNIIDTKKKQKQEDWLDATSITDIAKTIDKRIEDVKLQFLDDDHLGMGWQAGEHIDELVDKLLQGPEVGIPMYGTLINTVTKGARLRKYYLRSSGTGIGKSRTMIADVCTFACGRVYDAQFGWVKSGSSQPSLYIATEQDREEIQTMMLAFLSNVDEEIIVGGRLAGEELERVQEAARIMKNSPLWIEWMPDFSLKDIENCIKKYVREQDVKYVCFDYIKTSPKILEEITKRSGGVRLREDNILFMLSSRLKDLANEYGIFVMSSTQLNADWKHDEIPDQNLLRGAKSIADLADMGMILLRSTPEDLAKLESILASNPNFLPPTHKLSIYKNRGGRYTGCYLWCTADLGTCRINPEFCTDWRHTLMSIEDMKIIVEDEPAAWEQRRT